MDPDRFRALTAEEVAGLVRQDGGKVCVFPINGTRRWFLLEHPPQPGERWLQRYMDVAARNHIELYRLFFDHGLDTLLTPIFGPDLLERGEGYLEFFAEGLARLVTHADFLDFYRAYQVRVRFYGDYRRFFTPTPYAHLPRLFDEVTEWTRRHDRHRLFFGVCGHDAAEAVAELSVRYYTQHGSLPNKHTLIALYYGEPVGPVDLFIGFDRFSVFDMPLVATGNEDLYFTVCPSPYLTEGQLRDILYDHLHSRRGGEPDYGLMTEEDRAYMKAFYQANRGMTQGIGVLRGQVWYPLAQVREPRGATGA